MTQPHGGLSVVARVRRMVSTVAVCLAASQPAAALTIDAFEDPQMSTGGTRSYAPANVPGGERELSVGGPHSWMRVGDGRLDVRIDATGCCTEGPCCREASIIYDGPDHRSWNDRDGLGGLDLTEGGINTAFAVDVEYASGPFRVDLLVYVSPYTNTTRLVSPILSPVDASSPVRLLFPFDAFPLRLPSDFAEVGLVLVNFENQGADPLDVIVTGVYVVPEPTMPALMWAALATLGLLRRR